MYFPIRLFGVGSIINIIKMKKMKLFTIVLIYITFFLVGSVGNVFAQQNDTLSFLHISDIHLIFNVQMFQKDLAQNRSLYGNGVKPFKEFLKKVPGETRSDFVVATGDLVDMFEGEMAVGGKMKSQSEQFSRLLNSCKVPVYLILGNHDISSYSWKDSAKVSTQIFAERARATWIKNADCFNEGTYFSQVYNVGKTSYRMIYLDNGYNLFPPGSNLKNPYIDKIQLFWLKDQLQKSVDDIEIIMIHIPITSNSVHQNPSNEFYSLLSENPSVKLVLAGHDHKNAIKVFPSAQNNIITQVQTGSFGQNNDNWRVIRLTENKIIISLPGKTEKEIEILIP